MDYLKVWTSFRKTISVLNDAEKGRLFDAMLMYAETGEEPQEFKGNECFLWIAAQQDIDRTAQKCETLRANASKGGIAKSKNKQMIANDSKSYQTIANDSKEEQIEANAAHNIKKDNIKKDKEIENISNRRFTPPTLEEVTEYCQERRNRVSPQKFIDFYASKGWKVGNQPMKDWKACVRTWEQRDDNVKPLKAVPAAQYEQRDYLRTQDDVRQRMLAEMKAEGM